MTISTVSFLAFISCLNETKSFMLHNKSVVLICPFSHNKQLLGLFLFQLGLQTTVAPQETLPASNEFQKLFSTSKPAYFNHASLNQNLLISSSNGSIQLCKAFWRIALKSAVSELGIITYTNMS